MRGSFANPNKFFIKYAPSAVAFYLFLITQTALAGGPKCFLHGIITPRIENREKTSLSDMIRMKFQASEKKKCEQMLTAYCQYNVKEKGYTPIKLRASFQPDIDKTEENEYVFTEQCTLEEH